MVRPRLENLARWVVLVCSASRLLFLKVMEHWLHLAVWSTKEMEMLMFCTLRGTLAATGGGRFAAGLTGLTALTSVPR